MPRCIARVVDVVAIAAILAAPSTAASQHMLEFRGADTKYRYVDWNYTWRSAVVGDVFYVGVPGSNELNVGGGYAFKRGRLLLTPLAYAVAGKEESQRGVKLALLVSFEYRGWKLLAFAGQYVPVSGGVDSYQVLDALDLTRTFGPRLELGAQTGFYHAAETWNLLSGPVLKVNDRFGAWAASYRFGTQDEFRLGRVLTF